MNIYIFMRFKCSFFKSDKRGTGLVLHLSDLTWDYLYLMSLLCVAQLVTIFLAISSEVNTEPKLKQWECFWGIQIRKRLSWYIFIFLKGQLILLFFNFKVFLLSPPFVETRFSPSYTITICSSSPSTTLSPSLPPFSPRSTPVGYSLENKQTSKG